MKRFAVQSEVKLITTYFHNIFNFHSFLSYFLLRILIHNIRIRLFSFIVKSEEKSYNSVKANLSNKETNHLLILYFVKISTKGTIPEKTQLQKDKLIQK